MNGQNDYGRHIGTHRTSPPAGARDAARLRSLMNESDEQGSSATGASIPMPELHIRRSGDPEIARDGARDGATDADGTPAPSAGTMTLDGYRRLRQSYERGINADALQRLDQQRRKETDAPATAHYEQAAGDHQDRERVVSPAVTPTATVAAPVQSIADYDHNAANISYRRQIAEANGRLAHESRYERNDYVPDEKPRRGGIGRVVAGGSALVVGIGLAVVLYAGGAEQISLWLGGEREGIPDEDLTLVTERPTEASVLPAPTPGEAIANDTALRPVETEAADAEREQLLAVTDTREEMSVPASETRTRDLPGNAAKPAERDAAKPAKPEPTATRDAKPATTTATATAAKPKPATTTTATTTTAAKPKPAATTARGGQYVVQVHASDDKSEADRIASSLRSKGGSNVRIVETTKNGATIYRVRFGGFTSEDEAKKKAATMGYGSVWVVKE